jgi:hypothetical protein
MNKKIQQKIASQKSEIERRLYEANRPNFGGPTLSATNIGYEIAERTQAIGHGGIGAIHMMVKKLGLTKAIDHKVHLLKMHKPYHESDHVLNIAYNILCGGKTLDDIELRRNDAAHLDALGTESIPDPTTAGDFCRRFDSYDIDLLMDAINEKRVRVWQQQGPAFLKQTAKIDADGTFVPTQGNCKEGMSISHNGIWGYHALLVSLANTQEPLFLLNRSGNRPSHEGVVPLYNKAIALCRRAGFEDILLRGDTDFSLTAEFDRWTEDGVRFIFGYDARQNMVENAENMPENEYQTLIRKANTKFRKTARRRRPKNIKAEIVKDNGYDNIRLNSEEVADFEYQPNKCKEIYRVVALRKNLSLERGDIVLFDEYRYFFYITNDWTLSKHQVVREANHRCNQENLIAQLKEGVRALHAPVNTLNANWAYMVMASLAWTLKAWAALILPVNNRCQEKHSAERLALLRMDFRTFLNSFIAVPAQIIKTGRRIIYRFLAWNRSQHVFFRFLDGVKALP